MLLLSNHDVEQVLDVGTCLDALEEGYRDLVQQNAAYGAKFNFWVPSDEDAEGFFRFSSMEGATRSKGVFAIRMKLDILSWPGGLTEEKYCIEPGKYCGLILLVSTRTAEPLALIQDGYLQHMRVGGCCGLGVKYLARANASTVGMLGSGGMARTSLRAFCQVRNITHVRVYSPTREHREAYAEEMSEALEIDVQAVDNPRDAVRGVDVFSVCTDAIQPVMSADWLEPGMHFTNIGGGTDPRVHDRVDVTVKLGYGSPDRSVPVSEGGFGGEIVIATPEERARNPKLPGSGSRQERAERRYPLLTDLLTGTFPGRTSDDQITYFIDEGTQGLQFAAVGARVYELAWERKLGRQIPTDWLTQDIRD
jgi:alanine dehydrogenase